MEKLKKAKLCLSDGSFFSGYSFGSSSFPTTGEVVFNTGMVGYPESLTDPSYKGQFLVMTYPLIGNYGVPDSSRDEFSLKKNFESEKIHAQGLIISNYSEKYSHWSAVQSLHEWLCEENISGIYGIDTRALTKKLRDKGTMLGKIVFSAEEEKDTSFDDPNMRNLSAEVSCKNPVTYGKGRKKIALIDCGAKNNIIRAFLKRGIKVVRLPWNYDFAGGSFDGILLSNGPGDPKMCTETIKNTKRIMERGDTPILGICLGSQILGLASGADTYKLKYGHRSHNQPCLEAGTKKCYITSQNHGYAIDTKTLSEDWREWFVNNNDKTNEGIIHISKPFFGAQFHPEASPGPDDTEFIFDMFVRAMK